MLGEVGGRDYFVALDDHFGEDIFEEGVDGEDGVFEEFEFFDVGLFGIGFLFLGASPG